LLPYEVKYNPYTLEHILTQLQLLCFAILAFYVLYKLKQLPSEERGVNLDFDWTYRKLLPSIINILVRILSNLEVGILKFFKTVIAAFVSGVYSLSGPDSITTRIWTSGTMVLCIAIVLLVVLGIILI
jgi:multicomponent Na+:H+ antiporter subunit D